MANTIKIKRGLNANLSNVSLAEGEMAFTTDTRKLYISNTDEPINKDTTYQLTKSGSTISLTGSDGSKTSVVDSGQEYSNATTSTAGLMSASDKTKLNGLVASTSTPKAAGTAATGSETGFSRGDHVHPLQTTVSGNAGSATKLATARTLTVGKTGKTFNGTGNVSWTLDEIGSNVYVGTSEPSDADVDVWIDPSGTIDLSTLWNAVYPVGAIYISATSTSPATLFPGTTWTQITDKYLLASGSTYTAGTSYGAATHTHTSAAHTHSVNSHTHTSAAHTHTVNGHTHTSAAHTHTTGDVTLTTDQIPSHGHAQNYAPQGLDTNRMITTNSAGSMTGDNIHGKSAGSRPAAQYAWSNTAYTIVGTGRTGGGQAHNHGATGSTTPGATGSTSLTTNSTTPGATGGTSLTTNSTTPGATGSASSLPPSIAVYMWKRTA